MFFNVIGKPKNGSIATQIPISKNLFDILMSSIITFFNKKVQLNLFDKTT